MFLTKEDVDDIIMLVEMLRSHDPVVVDLGAGTGNTALAVLQTKPESKVWTFDNNFENLNWAFKNLQAFEIDTSNWFPVNKDASIILEEMESIDLLLHDADHSEESVRKDLHAWLMTCLQTGSIIWVHDYLSMSGAEENYPGVKIVCDEFVEKGYLEQIPTTGIGFAARVL